MSFPLATFFAVEAPSAIACSHLITALDAELLQAWVRINGAKLAVFRAAPPFDADDRYQPFGENTALKDWELAYNQGELLALTGYAGTLVTGNPTMIVGSNADEAMLAQAEAAAAETG